jgi:hypothetical protein
MKIILLLSLLSLAFSGATYVAATGVAITQTYSNTTLTCTIQFVVSAAGALGVAAGSTVATDFALFSQATGTSTVSVSGYFCTLISSSATAGTATCYGATAASTTSSAVTTAALGSALTGTTSATVLAGSANPYTATYTYAALNTSTGNTLWNTTLTTGMTWYLYIDTPTTGLISDIAVVTQSANTITYATPTTCLSGFTTQAKSGASAKTFLSGLIALSFF